MKLTETNTLRIIPRGLFCLCVATALSLVGCSDPEESIGSGVGPAQGGQHLTKVFYADTTVSYTSSPISTGGSAYIYVGHSFNVESLGLIRFHRPYLPENYSLDTTRDATLMVAWEGGFGEDQSTTVEFNPIDLAWSEHDTLTNDSLPAMVIVGRPHEVSGDTGRVFHTIHKNAILDWMRGIEEGDTTASDTGLTILIFAPSSDPQDQYMARFLSRSAPEDSITGLRKPRLYLPVNITDTLDNVTSDSLAVIASDDLFIPVYTDTTVYGSLIVGSGIPFVSLLRFDMAEMWALQQSNIIVVNQAIVTLFREPVESPWLPTKSIWPFRLTNNDWVQDPGLMEQAGYIIYTTAVDSTADSLSLLVTRPAADWVKSIEDNHGLALHSGGAGLDLDRVAFAGYNAADPARRPKLTVHFTRIDR